MEKMLTRTELKVMGFSDPCPTNTMSKKIIFKDGSLVHLNVWVENNGIANYAYFGTPKNMDCGHPYRLLGIDYDGYYSGKHKKSPYPNLYNKKDIEDICFNLTGKSIYEIDIKETQKEREEIMGIWQTINNYKTTKPNNLFRKLLNLLSV